MDYFYRFHGDGSCDIICTRCFLKIGTALDPPAARAQANLHVCQVAPRAVVRTQSNLPGYKVTEETRERILRWMDGLEILNVPAPVLLLLAVVVFYILPTLVEFAVLRKQSLWAVSILFGDLTGCIGIFVALGKKKLAVILYLGLTCVECWLYSTQLISAHSLVYLMDVVPTMVMAGAILSSAMKIEGLPR